MVAMVESLEETGIGDPRAVYTPPCVVRMTDLKQGAGSCVPGSGDTECCSGSTAIYTCSPTGGSVN